MCFGINVYPKQKLFSRLAYFLNYWEVGTHTLDCTSASETQQSTQDLLDNSQCTNNQSDETMQPPSQTHQTFCYCNGPEAGEMIGCDNQDCTIEWFHLRCLKISPDSIPKGKWYCPNCKKLPKFNKSKGKGKSKK